MNTEKKSMELLDQYNKQTEDENTDSTDNYITANSDFCMAVCCDECCSCLRSTRY